MTDSSSGKLTQAKIEEIELPALEDMFTGDRYYLQSMGYTQEKERKRSSGQNG